MSTLHLETEGNGDPLVFLHGWGLHGGVWSAVAKPLAREFRVIRVDLPGFGASAPLQEAWTAAALAKAVAAEVPHNAVWIGWSLGGLVALAAAAAGVPVKKLVLVGATPRFTQGDGWPHAMVPAVLAGFAGELQQDFRATILRFLALQTRGSERAREALRALRDTVFARGEPSLEALRGGLEVLRDTDLRARLPELTMPVLLLHGAHDMLAPLAAAQATAAALPAGRLEVIPGAGHAPFLSHPEHFDERLSSFLHE